MSFGVLYRDVQELGVPVSIGAIRQLVQKIIPGRGIRIVKAKLNRDLLQGYYISPRNPDVAYFGAAPGHAVIVVCDSLSPEWFKFVQIKEIMHALDDPMHSTNNGAELEALMTGLCESADPDADRSPQEQSEHECFWMAVALSCPEKIRIDLHSQRDAGSITDHKIAEMLELPEKLVPALFDKEYKANVAFLLGKYPPPP